MASGDSPTSWPRQLLLAFGALVVVALVIGAVLSAFALGAAKVSGIDDEAAPSASAQPSLALPSAVASDVASDEPSPAADPTSSTSPTPEKSRISLQVLPNQVSAGQRINLTGVYPGAEGARLQVQRFEGGGWVDFPVTATVSGGQFTTYITTSRTGDTRLRVADESANLFSNQVRVRIG